MPIDNFINDVKKLLLLPLLILLSACGNSQSDKSFDRKVENLTAFAKVYGHVKYFHPSDEAKDIDWDKFAAHPVMSLKNAQNDRDLKEKMEVLFSLIAPTVSFYNEKPEGDHFLSEYLEMINTDTTRLKTVAWQHKGVYLGVDNRPYRSSRTFRNDFDLNRAVRISQNLDLNELTGKEIRLRSSIWSLNQDEDSQAELIIITDRQNLFSEKFDLSDQRDNRKELELRVELDENAESIDVGFHFQGTTDLLINSIELEYRSDLSDWEPYLLQKLEFINNRENSSAEWELASMGVFEYEKPEDGSFRITSKPKLFEHYPSVGETAVQQISGGLWSEVPLALFSKDEFTLPQIGASEIEKQLLSQFKHQVDQVYLNPIVTNDQDHQLANIIIAWNVFQHFYPYFDVVDVDWNGVLTEALERVLLDHSGDQYSETLHWMIAQLHDGHGAVTCGDDASLYNRLFVLI